jgi:RimJ/RimL family protein N-acetyltransferase
MDEPSLRVLQSGDEESLEEFLLPRIESSMLLIGNNRASGLTDNGLPYTGTYAAAFEVGKIVGVAAHYWNSNLVLQAPGHLKRLCQLAIEKSRRAVGGVIGPAAQVSAVSKELGINNADAKLDEVEKLYSLRLDDLIVPSGLKSGALRGRMLKPHDVDLVTKWRVAYSIETLGEQDSPQLWKRNRESVERYMDERRVWILEDQGEPVAISAFNSAIDEAVQVGGVWTPPDLRRRGYSRAVVAASLLDARSKGVEKGILFTGEKNIAAQRAYTALGFRQIGDYRILLLRSPMEIT